MKKTDKKDARKNVLLSALSGNLDKMSKSPWIGSFKDGKELICPYCDQPVQPCKTDPSAMCERMLHAGTEGKEIKEALKDPSQDRYGVCLECGQHISKAHLKKHPTAELCTQCVGKERKVQSNRPAQA